MPALVVPVASTVRKCSHTFDFTCSQNLQVCCNSYWPTTPQGCCWDWLKSIVTIIVLFYWLSVEICTLFKNGETLLVALSLSLSLCSLFSDVLLLSPLTGRCESVNELPRRGIDTDPKPWVSRPAQPEPVLGAHVRRQPWEWPHVSPHQLYLKAFFRLN